MLKSSEAKRSPYSTSTRRAIVDALIAQRRYLTANELYRFIKDGRPKLALSTVYRTLELLERLGTVSSRVDEAGETAYVHCSGAHHHHAICRVCGEVAEVDCGAMEQFRNALLSEQSFALDDHAIEFYGRCARCR